MLKKRIIPKMLLNSRNIRGKQMTILETTRNFSNNQPVGSPVSQAKIYESQLADELIIINITKEENNELNFQEIIKEMSYELATPLAVGGKIKKLDQAKELFENGADKIIVNTNALENPNLISEIANLYGSQSIIVGIDLKLTNNEYKMYTNNGGTCVDKKVEEWLYEAEERGCGEIMISSIDRDGTGIGLDLRFINRYRRNIKVPLIVSGGCGTSQHFVEGYREGADAVAAGRFFCRRDQNPLQCRSHVLNAGIKVRS